jgi:probable O-glycosylation ligase (exosortase A-associated)
MRDLLLAAIFAGILPFALRHTWVGVLLWTWFSLMNPHRLTYGFANDFPFAAIAAGATLLSIVWNMRQLHLPRDASVVSLVLFMLWMCVTTLFAIYPEGSLPDLDRALKIQLMVLVAVAAIRTRKHIEYFIWANVLSLGFYGLKGGIFTIASGGSSRVWGPSGSFIDGNNELGMALTMVIPLAYYLRLVATKPWVRHALLALLLLCAAAVLGTQSRGAFLALVGMGAVLWLRSPKKALGAIAILTAGALLITFMPDSWEQRMRTIGEYKADSSAQGRLNAWSTAINIANDRVTGGGFLVETRAVFAQYAPDPEVVFTAHSIYFQALGEQGWIGLLLFLSIGFFTFRNAARVRKRAREREDTMWLFHLAGMIQVSMVGYAVGGAFLSLTYFDLPYNILVMAVACNCWLNEQRWKTETTGAFGASATVAVAQPSLPAPSASGAAGGPA